MKLWNWVNGSGAETNAYATTSIKPVTLVASFIHVTISISYLTKYSIS
jgi:hypothetical protein